MKLFKLFSKTSGYYTKSEQQQVTNKGVIYMIWKPIGLNDQVWMTERIRQYDYPISDYNFTHLFIWRELHQLAYADLEDFLIIRGIDPFTQEPYFYMPIGKGNIEQLIPQLTEETALISNPITFRAITAEMAQQIARAVENKPILAAYKPLREEYEYIYELENLAFYKGRNLSRKRESCKSFESHYEWSFASYDQTMAFGTFELIKRWHGQNGNAEDLLLKAEFKGIEDVINHHDQLNCQIFVLIVNENICGIIISERLNQAVLVIHYAKADRQFKGAYDLMLREISLRFMGQFKYLSLEEDMGIDGLRKSKLLYRPVALIKKGLLQVSITAEDSNER